MNCKTRLSVKMEKSKGKHLNLYMKKICETNSDESSTSAAPSLPSTAGFLFSCLLLKGAVDSTGSLPSCQAGEVTFRDLYVLARKLAHAQAQEKQQMAMLKIFPENDSTPYGTG